MNYYIGIDLGTSSCKGSVVDKFGKVYGSHSVKYGVGNPAPNYSEQNPADWYNAAVEILKILSKGIEDDIKGVSIAGQMHGLVMLDENDRVIRPAILWNDGKSKKQTNYLNVISEAVVPVALTCFSSVRRNSSQPRRYSSNDFASFSPANAPPPTYE